MILDLLIARTDETIVEFNLDFFTSDDASEHGWIVGARNGADGDWIAVRLDP